MQSPDVTRSIRRFLQILELFEAERRPLSSSEIAEALEAPKSSTGNLLRALVDLGVLIIDRRSLTYFPTVRFATLNGWIVNSWLPSPEFLANLDGLRDTVGETVCLSTPSDLMVEVLHVAQGVHPITLNMVAGQRLWMPYSAIGNAYLTTLPSATLGALSQRLAQAARKAGRGFDADALQKQVRSARRAGFAVAYDGITTESGGVAIPLPSHVGPRPLVLSVGGPSERVRKRETELAAHLVDFAKSIRRQPAERRRA